MLEFILGLIGKLLVSEVIDWSPKLAEAILQQYAKKLPTEVAPRALEEARALLDGTPGNVIRLARALDLLRASRRISHEYYYPEIPFRPYSLAFTRMLDRMSATLALVIHAPIFGFIAIGIKLTSSGPVFERSRHLHFNTGRRAGSALRFRTTFRDQAAGLEVGVFRKTRFGTFLRRTTLEELPKLWNVACGDISMIGRKPLVSLTPGADALSLVNPKRPELLGPGLIQLSPEEEQKFLQNPIGNYFIIMAKVTWSVLHGIQPRF